MKELTITLTKEEIELLQISLCETALNLEREADQLENHNQSGINTNSIKSKREHKKSCDALWLKLYTTAKA